METKINLNQETILGTDGWTSANETWTYASASTITVPSGAAAKYKVGDKVKLTQTTVKYFYIITVADTLLTVTGGSDYTVANAAITLNYYSHQANPIGFPAYFSITPTYTGFSAAPNLGVKLTITGRLVTYTLIVLANGTSNATGFTMTTVGASLTYVQSIFAVINAGTDTTGYFQIDPDATTITFYASLAKGGFTASGNKSASGMFSYHLK